MERFLALDMVQCQIKRAVKENLMAGGCEEGKVGEYVERLLADTELGVGLKNRIYVLDQDAKKRPRKPSKGVKPRFKQPHELSSVVDASRRQWDSRLRFELENVISKLGRPAVRVRDAAKPSSSDDDFPVRFVYTSEDLLEAVLAIKNPNFSGSHTRLLGWNTVRIQLKTPTILELRAKYRELRPDIRQMGVDNKMYGSEWFGTERNRTGATLASTGYIPHLKHFAKTGVPQALRPEVWGRILGCITQSKNRHEFRTLKQNVKTYDMVTDDLVQFDVHETCDQPEFFVFEDDLTEAMLLFSRDTAVPRLCSVEINTSVLETSFESKKGGRTERCAVPPSAVIPYYQMSVRAAPFCFLHDNVEDMYFMHRAMYCRYFCRLNTVSSERDTILYLSKTFEDLLISANPNVFYHAVDLGVPPLKTVFPWIFSCFAGYLPVFQVLQLWDRVIAYDSLELVAALAAAVYAFRAGSVLACKTADDVIEVFKETIHIQAIPLLQHFLFSSRE